MCVFWNVFDVALTILLWILMRSLARRIMTNNLSHWLMWKLCILELYCALLHTFFVKHAKARYQSRKLHSLKRAQVAERLLVLVLSLMMVVFCWMVHRLILKTRQCQIAYGRLLFLIKPLLLLMEYIKDDYPSVNI